MKSCICVYIALVCFTCNVHAEIELLPNKNLFDAPIADPRWPKFLMGVSHDFKDNLGKTLWSFNLGENIGLAQMGSKEQPFEIGIQAAAFSLMDIDSIPSKLINADYFLALGLSHRRDEFQYLLQLSHVSSHVGDEFLLSEAGQGFKRINLSYETVKCFIRYKSNVRISPYIVLGYIVHVDPAPIKRLSIAGGFDYLSHRIVFNDSTRLIAGVYITAWQENNYKPTTTMRIGLQYERTKYCNRYLQLLLEYKAGKSQQGQFYKYNIQQLGILVVLS